MTGLRSQLLHLPLFPALAVAMLGKPAVAHAQASASDVVQDEVIVTGGVITEKPPKGTGFRFRADIWAANEAGEKKTVGWVEADVGV